MDNTEYFAKNGLKGTLTIRQPKSYNFEPKEDITAYEVALILPIVISNGDPYFVENLLEKHPTMKRHFQEMS
jgi:hypothetical protein